MAGVKWDTIGIVWKDPNSNPTPDIIKTAIEDYANLISGLRAQMKTTSTQIEQATKSKASAASLQSLKNTRKDQLEALYQSIDTADKLGYGAIVENLGGHQKLINGLMTILIDCNKSEDFVGKLPKAVFSLLAKIKTLTDGLLERCKFPGIQKRWNKKGDAETKEFIAAIRSNTVDEKKRVAEAQKATEKADEGKKLLEKIEQARRTTTEPVKNANSTKRPHEGDGSNGMPNKKFAADVAGTPASSKPAAPKRPTNLLANNLLGISSKPTPKPLPKKREPSPPTESKLGALLASIAKPPEAPKAPEAPARPPETPEEKARRERKESRRHLRVKFKDGPELEQIKLFKHEEAEDEGRQDNMLRDAHDDRSEGMMHKQRVLETMDGNLEDDETFSENIAGRTYPKLKEVDFSDMDKASRHGPTYVTRGGHVTFTTAEQRTQERREALELLVVYNDPEDIPPSPKEAPISSSEPDQQAYPLKEPTPPWLLQRLQTIQLYGPERAAYYFQSQTSNRDRGSVSATTPSTYSTQKQYAPPHMDPEEYARLLEAVRPLIGKPYPPREPPEWMSPAAKQEWWEGYNRDQAVVAATKQAAGEHLAVQMQAAHIQAPQMIASVPIAPAIQVPEYQPQMAQPSMSYQAPTPDLNQQVQSFLAGMSNDESDKTVPPQFDFKNWQNTDQNQNYAEQNQDPNYSDANQYARWDRSQETGRPKANQDNLTSNYKQGKKWKGGFTDGPLDENGEYKGKKKPCRFWREGKCAKGEKCTFLHD